MDKFTDKLGTIEEKKFVDKTKNEIYDLIKEKISVSSNSDIDVSIKGLEELTESIYSYIQKERIKQEVLTLEGIKGLAATGTLNFKEINDHIDRLNS